MFWTLYPILNKDLDLDWQSSDFKQFNGFIYKEHEFVKVKSELC